MAAYTITEPHPTVPKNSYTHSGRGGAGNFFRAPATTSPSGVPTRTVSNTTTTPAAASSSSSSRFYSGRGGAGNAHLAGERPVLSFDEEFTRAEVREKTARLSHVGRGGAGNIFSIGSGTSSKATAEKERRDSSSTTDSTRSSAGGFWGRISGH